MRIRQFSKHSIFYKEGESDDAVYIVLSGIARLVFLNRKRELRAPERKSLSEAAG
jgi:CRP-like cAMP-binding protein